MDAESLTTRLRQTRKASRGLGGCGDERVSDVLRSLADTVSASKDELLEANRSDLARMDPGDPKYDRLLLDASRIDTIRADLRRVADLPGPVGEVLEARTLENGLELTKVRVPIGVVAVIYESRPNVTFDVFALCLKTLNACVLKGSRDAHETNCVAIRLIHESLEKHNIDTEVALLAPPERSALPVILHAVDDVDLAIPRGSRDLINFVRDQARIPVIETGAGIVHTYIDVSANFDKATSIVTNAKARRVSVCNALDTLVIHRNWLPRLPEMLGELGESYGTTVYADEDAFEILQGRYAGPLQLADEQHYGQEFLSFSMSVKTVDDLEQALGHIHQYSSKHSEAIVAEDPGAIETFLHRVDAAAVYANASTAFTDGGEFGLGAEIGISTQKLHARGPMALRELTSYKWLVRGSGHIRP